MNSSPRLSVVMPAYNAGSFILTAVRSILAQSLGDLELLILDDGSDDGTERIVAGIPDQRIRYHRHEAHRGLAAIRNEGMSIARGSYIAMMDADDISHPHRLEMQAALLDAHPGTGACGVWLRTIDGRRHTFRYAAHHDDIRCEMLFDSHMPHGASMLRADVARAHAPLYSDVFRSAEDYDMWTRLAPHTRFEILPRVLYEYRQHEGQTSARLADSTAQATRSIHSRLLAGLGIEYDDADLDVHGSIAQWRPPDGDDAPARIHAWMVRLLEANAVRHTYDQTALKRCLTRRFFRLVPRYPSLTPEMLGAARQMPLYREADISSSERIRSMIGRALRRSPQ
ncbi:MAG: glycosyltransferase family 2 protein [Ignavibacteriae bacterium]|nr:glycosyltransferase family 2 protein [Ignavibacteriota bacterium]